MIFKAGSDSVAQAGLKHVFHHLAKFDLPPSFRKQQAKSSLLMLAVTALTKATASGGHGHWDQGLAQVHVWWYPKTLCSVGGHPSSSEILYIVTVIFKGRVAGY